MKINEILDILELNVFPDKKFLKKHYKNLILKYHPDSSKDKDNHEKTLQIIEAYNLLINKFELYKFEHEIHRPEVKEEKKAEVKKENIFQILENGNILIGLPLKGLLYFLSPQQYKIVSMFNRQFISYNSKFIPYYFINRYTGSENSFQTIALYEKDELFAIVFNKKVRFYDYAEIQPQKILWENHFGIYFLNSNSIYIPFIFKEKNFLL